ncbi:hypothetical protein VZT92_019699 [Zoarces viviparus]|uniref:Flavodoxin-like fold domain-containing protein n=1 Tax=Zoarces viviparus TaxID=48416 RepID=A0AAW1EMF9_ZOAVI
MATKKVLIVYAHQSTGSFNAAAKDAAVEVLAGQGCTVAVSDLYAMKFKATATAEDITGEVNNADHFRYAEETKLAWEEGKLLTSLRSNANSLRWTSSSFSSPCTEKRYSQGIFNDKKAMLSFTTGCHESMLGADGINGDMNVTLWPLQIGILHYCGFQVLAPQIFWAPPHIPSEERSTMLEGWHTRLQGVLCEKPLSFTPMDCFDGEKGFQLKPEVHEKNATKEYGLTVGTHLGKAPPPNKQMKAGV